MKWVINDWHNRLSLELEMLEGYKNIDKAPPSLYVRAILIEPDTKIRHYQKLITVHFNDEDKLES